MAMSKISFTYGLISFAAKLDKATETVTPPKRLCVGASPGQTAHDPKPLHAPTKCDDCGVITDYSALVKGVQVGGGYAILSAEDVAQAKTDHAAKFHKKINLVPHAASDFEGQTAPGKSLYYMLPDGNEDHYQLMVRLIAAHPELAFASMYTPRTSAAQYRVVSRNGVLLVEERVQAEKIKATPTVGGTVNEGLYAALDAMTPTLVQPYDVANYADDYLTALADLAAKATDVVSIDGDTATPAAPAPLRAVNDDDLVAQLQALATAS